LFGFIFHEGIVHEGQKKIQSILFSEYSVLGSIIFSLLRAIKAFLTYLKGLINTYFSVIYNKEKNFTWLQARRNEI